MSTDSAFEIFLVATPGLESELCAEAREAGFENARVQPGGLTLQGGWPDVWRANLQLRGANRVLARLGSFRVVHLAQLDKLARRFDWGVVLRPDIPLRVEASCKASRIYHAGAVVQRVETALRESFGAIVSEDAGVCIRARIEDNVCTLSVDTSGDLLHRRGYKQAVSKAPMRESLAAGFLRASGFDGREPVLDPMCGSGTFVLEAAEIAAGLAPGRERSFAFEHLRSFDAEAWQVMQTAPPPRPAQARFYGSDRDAGAIRMSRENAQRAGLADWTRFEVGPVAQLERPPGDAGLVIVNPPYGARIGNKAGLKVLYASLGTVMRTRFSGWRVSLITADPMLARATRLPFDAPGPVVDHGGLKIRLYTTPPLK